MSEDTSGHETFAAALNGTDGPQIEGTVDAASPEPGQGGEGQGMAAQPEPAAASPQGPQDRNEGMVPSWRLREISEQREVERRERAQEQRELAELRKFREEQDAERARKEQEAALSTEDFYGSDPAQYIDKRFQHNAKQVLTPIEQRLQQFEGRLQQETQDRSRYYAEKEHGRETVATAWQRTMQALQAGDPGAVALDQRIRNSRDPYGDLIEFDRRRTLYEKTGGSLEEYNKRQQEELLKDPAFLQRAIEAHRSVATPVQTRVPGRAQASAQPRGTLPSLNRQTSAADNGDGEDAASVFASEIAARGRHAT